MAEFEKRCLWAPWRMQYIEGIAGQDGCFLCRAQADAAADEGNYVLWRGAHTIALLNRFPYSSGHVLIAPVLHAAELEELPDDVLLALMRQTRDVKRVLQKALNAQGFNIGLNLGRCAGAGLPEHLHIHVVPRWGGDTNFMAVIGEAKVIPQALTEARRRFLAAAQALGLVGEP